MALSITKNDGAALLSSIPWNKDEIAITKLPEIRKYMWSRGYTDTQIEYVEKYRQKRKNCTEKFREKEKRIMEELIKEKELLTQEKIQLEKELEDFSKNAV